MPATPGEQEVPDLFTEGAGQSAEEFLARSRLQVGLVVSTGVMVIVITTLVVVLTGGNGQSITDGPNRSVGINSTLVLPFTPSAIATASAQPNETASPQASVAASQSKRPPTSPPPTTAPPVVIATLVSLSCDSPVTGGANSTCTVTLSGSAHADLSIAISSSNPSIVSVPGTVVIAAGATSESFTAGTDALTMGESDITATLAGVTPPPFTVKVTLL